jgi:hypothetical protein
MPVGIGGDGPQKKLIALMDSRSLTGSRSGHWTGDAAVQTPTTSRARAMT